MHFLDVIKKLVFPLLAYVNLYVSLGSSEEAVFNFYSWLANLYILAYLGELLCYLVELLVNHKKRWSRL